MCRLLTAIAVLSAAVLSGCGYKPLEAPCAMSEGGAPTALERPILEPTAAQRPIQALSYAGPDPHRAPEPFDSTIPDCGPLRPINAERLI